MTEIESLRASQRERKGKEERPFPIHNHGNIIHRTLPHARTHTHEHRTQCNLFSSFPKKGHMTNIQTQIRIIQYVYCRRNPLLAHFWAARMYILLANLLSFSATTTFYHDYFDISLVFWSENCKFRTENEAKQRWSAGERKRDSGKSFTYLNSFACVLIYLQIECDFSSMYLRACVCGQNTHIHLLQKVIWLLND